MSLCIIGLAQAVVVPAAVFTLSWTHSVEGTRWEESWRVSGHRLEIVSARVKGSGAGMEMPMDAVLADGWWTFRPARPSLKEVVLASSGATRDGWRLCWSGGCRVLGAAPGPSITLRACRSPG